MPERKGGLEEAEELLTKGVCSQLLSLHLRHTAAVSPSTSSQRVPTSVETVGRGGKSAGEHSVFKARKVSPAGLCLVGRGLPAPETGSLQTLYTGWRVQEFYGKPAPAVTGK